MNLKQHTTGPSDPQPFLGSEMGERIRALDWGTTSRGPMDRWPRSLRTLIDMLLPHPLPMIVLWGPDLIQIYNDGYARIAGRKHPEALSMPTRQCWPELWHVNGPIYERVLRRGEAVLLEDQSFPTTRTGALEDAWFTLTYSPVRDDNGRIGGVLLTILETTAKVIAEREGRYQEDHRAQTQRALRESEEQFRTLISATSDVVYRISRDWSEIRLLQGRDFLPDAVESSRSWLEKYVHPDDQPRVLDTINRAISGKSDFELEHRVIRVDGSLGWTYSRAIPIVDAQGENVEWFGTASDITARKEAEEVLRRSHERAQILADSIAQLLYSDAPQAVIQSLGERVMEHLGCHLFLNYVVDQEEDCLLLNACSGIPDEAVAGISRLDHGVAVCGCVARDGQPIVAERTAVAEQRARVLRRLAAELNEAEHRERKRLARLLHDNLQQLLVAARFRLQVVLSGDQSEREKHVQHMDQLLQECAATSRNLMQELSPPILQMGTLTEILEWLGTWCAEKHGLMTTVETDDDIPPVPEHIRVFVFQAVREMLFNVVKHSGAKQACVDIFARSGTLLVQVQDGGNGFDPQILDTHLLHPEGFGLFHIRERLEALGGRLEFRAAPGDGARFRIVLPIAEGDGSPLDASPVRRVKTPGRSQERPKDAALRLLIVDDHAVVREGFIRLLDRQPDITVVGEAADGEQAVHQAAMLRPDVILMDVNMPGMNGFEATRRIKARQPDVVVIGLSLDEDKSVERAMREAKADGYVSKQASGKELLEVLRRVCRRTRTD